MPAFATTAAATSDRASVENADGRLRGAQPAEGIVTGSSHENGRRIDQPHTDHTMLVTVTFLKTRLLSAA